MNTVRKIDLHEREFHYLYMVNLQSSNNSNWEIDVSIKFVKKFIITVKFLHSKSFKLNCFENILFWLKLSH